MPVNAASAERVPGVPQSATPWRPAELPEAADGPPTESSALADWFTGRRGWRVERDPDGSLWLPVGADFDVVEVPAAAGRRAVGMLTGYGQAALAPGPVALAPPGRCLFFTAPGARDDLPELLDWLDWGGIDLNLRAHGPGDRIPAPAGDAWLHGPTAVPPEVIALLATIAQCCSRHALAVSSRRVASPRRGV